MSTTSLDSEIRAHSDAHITEGVQRDPKYLILLKECNPKAKDILFSPKKRYSLFLKQKIGEYNSTEVHKLLEREQSHTYSISTDFNSVRTEHAVGSKLNPKKYLDGMSEKIVLYDIDLVDENGRKAYVGKLMMDSEKAIADQNVNQRSLSCLSRTSRTFVFKNTNNKSSEKVKNKIYKEILDTIKKVLKDMKLKTIKHMPCENIPEDVEKTNLNEIAYLLWWLILKFKDISDAKLDYCLKFQSEFPGLEDNTNDESARPISKTVKQHHDLHSISTGNKDTNQLKNDDTCSETDTTTVEEKSKETSTSIVDVVKIKHVSVKPQNVVTESQSAVCRIRVLKQKPRIVFTEEDIEEVLSEIINQSVRKGALRDESSIPPHVIHPTSHSIDILKSDWLAFQTNKSQWWQNVLPFSGNEPMSNFFTRLSSFSTWPHDAPYSAVRLVEAGFLYDKSSSAIKCNFCGIQVDCTRQIHEFHRRNMTAIQIHTQLNSDCEHVKNMEQLRREDNDITDSSMTSAARNKYSLNISPGNTSTGKSDNHCNDQITDNSIKSESNFISDINHSEQRNTSALTNNIQNVSDSGQIALLDKKNTESNSNGAIVPQHSLGSSQNAVMPELINQKNNPKISQVNFETNFASSINEENEIYALKHPHFKSVTSRLETYRSWQIPEIQDPKVLTEAGFYFTGNRDIVRCFCCDIGLAEWEDDDEPWLEHARHSPSCEYLNQIKGGEYINSVQTEWKKIYNPKHAEFNETQARLDSFVGWPQELNQRPDVLAAAGFFYTGQNDVVRCHYCDGGLREWEPQDEPWTEHARWFPFCKYLMKIKGLGFIEEVAKRNCDNALNSSELTTNQQGPINGASVNNSDTIQQLFHGRLEKNADLLSTTAAETLMCMGYSRNNIQYVINLFIRKNGQRSFNAEDLLDIIMDMEDRKEQFPVQPDFNSESQTRHDLEAENRHLKYQMICITCKEKDRNMVLIPCGHRVFCEQCSSNVKRCPICHKNAKKKVKVFIV